MNSISNQCSLPAVERAMTKKLKSYYFFFHSKDVRLPVQLQRVMAAEAEASREARAKVRMPISLHNSCCREFAV